MPTTFNWIYLGVDVTIDPTEGNGTAENAATLVGRTYGSAGAPLYDRITQTTTIDNGGTSGSLDNNNSAVNDQFSTNIGAGTQTFTFDANAVYNATITYANGTTATITAVLVQATTGELFLAPEITANADTTAQQAFPIVSITLGTVVNNTNNLGASRATTAWDNGWVDGTGGNDLINGSYVEPVADGSDRVDNSDGITAGSLNDDRIRAGAGNDTVLAGVGNDVVFGGIGDDSLSGEGGQDTIHGEDGNDRLFGGAGLDQLFGGIGNDSLDGGGDNDVLFGGAGADTLLGDAGADTLDGGTEGDSLFGGAGADLIHGGDGADTIYFGADDDTVYGGAGDDLIDDIAATNLAGVNLIYGGSGNDTVWSGQGDDQLFGDEGNDALYGEDGNDALTGGIGDDLLDSGAGNDLLFGGDGIDSLYGGAGADALTGGLGGDLIDGGADRDTIYGDIGDTITGGGTGDDFDTLDLTAWGKDRTNIYRDTLNPENGYVEFLDEFGAVIGTMTFTDIETIIPCFTPGTRILTARGQVAVETLRAGDLVVTRDGGLRALKWVGRRDLNLAALIVNPALRPVTIRAGALGPNMPERDMRVSPQHRMLIEGPRAEMLFGEREVLVAALHLLGLPGVSQDPVAGISYIHLMFDRHEIVLSDGAWSESFQPADRMVRGMEDARRDEVLALFPQLETDGIAFPAARLSLRAHEARVLLAA